MSFQPEVITSQQQVSITNYTVTNNQGSWSTNVCDCCDDMGICLCGGFVPCILACRVAEDYGECCLLPYLPGTLLAMRTGMREKYNIQIIVLWVGTNNHGDSAEQVAEGIGAIVRLIHSKQPTAKVLILGLLPRGRSPNALRVKNARVNQLIQEALPSLPGASFLDVDPGFVLSDGTISHHDMYDYLHLTRAGYATVCQPIHTRLLAMLEQQKI
ncbi:PA1B2 acetylhydrolase, partial [Polyodon spathula]|nr:PA1B2 acetylhydrolase [Polyodon spathula]